MKSLRKRKYTWEEFLKEFQPKATPQTQGDPDPEYFFETFGEDYEKVRASEFHHVWTLVEEDSKWYIITGVHFVNRLNYLICDVPWTDEQDARGIYVKY